jgi:iduronate 2-sulfatase
MQLQEKWIVMLVKEHIGLLTFLLLCAWIAPINAQSNPPLVIWIVADDLNDYIWQIEGSEQYTPHLQRLAQQGNRFDACYTQSPLCNPSRTSFITGLTPQRTGVNNNRNENRFRDGFSETVVTVPEHFKENGYYTVGLGKIFHNFWKDGFDNDYHADQPDPLLRNLSWNEFSLVQEDPFTVMDRDGIDGEGYLWGRVPDDQESALGDHKLTSIALDVLDRYAMDPAEFDHRPLMIMLGLVKPHTPHFVPARFFDPRFAADPLRALDINYYSNTNTDGWRLPDYGPLGLDSSFSSLPLPAQHMALHNGRHQLGIDRYARQNADRTALTEEELRLVRMANINMAYYAAVRFMDYQVGRVLDRLDSLGLAQDAIIVFHSDHGFSQGERQHWTKQSLWRNDVRVPLLISGPGQQGGRIYREPVSLLDLFPTVCDLSGIPHPVVDGDPDYLDGSSLLPLMNGQGYCNPVISQIQVLNDATINCDVMRTLMTEDWHLLEIPWSPAGSCAEGDVDPFYMLYNLQDDPGEWFDVFDAPENQFIANHLVTMLEAGKASGTVSMPLHMKIKVNNLSGGSSGGFYQDTDILQLESILVNAYGDTLNAIPAGTNVIWQINKVTGQARFGPWLHLNLGLLKRANMLADGKVRVDVALVDPATQEALAMDSEVLFVQSASSSREPAKPEDCERDADGRAVYFNLNGQRITEPELYETYLDGCGGLRVRVP